LFAGKKEGFRYRKGEGRAGGGLWKCEGVRLRSIGEKGEVVREERGRIRTGGAVGENERGGPFEAGALAVRAGSGKEGR